MNDEARLGAAHAVHSRRVEQVLARTLFWGFFSLVVALLVVRTPPWNLMDDASLLGTAENMTDSGAIIGAIWQQSVADLRGWGIFRPVYWTWVAVVYSTFSQSVLGAYLITAAFNFVGLLVWGAAFVRLFDVHGVWRARMALALPLLMFLFPPYWNVFTYVSLQEKFVILFAGVATFAFARGIDEERWGRWALLGWSACLLGLLAKPTMITVPLAIIVLLLGTRVLGSPWSSGSRAWGVFSLSTVMLYLVFTLQVQTRGGYTAGYSDGLAPIELLRRAIGAPRSVLLLAAVGVVAVLAAVRRGRDGRLAALGREALLPLGLLAYLAVLLPWGYPTYLLSGTAPFVVGSMLVLAHRAGPVLNRLAEPAWIFVPVLASLLLGVFALDIVPKVGWQTDLGEVKAFLQNDIIGDAVFYFPPPFVEHAGSLGSFTGRDVRFLPTGELRRTDLPEAEVFLIAYLDQQPVVLEGVEVGPAVFENPSWAVHPLGPNEDLGAIPYKPEFPDERMPLGRRIRRLLG